MDMYIYILTNPQLPNYAKYIIYLNSLPVVAADESLIFQLDLSRPYFAERPVGNSLAPASLRAVGWEPNERGRPGPRIADLSRTLDPRSLMNQAVDLNVSLMKWRLWPDLNTDVISSTKCLLFGAGTLGCAVCNSIPIDR